jgi:hypothetical protein
MMSERDFNVTVDGWVYATWTDREGRLTHIGCKARGLPQTAVARITDTTLLATIQKAFDGYSL